jgi:hypothetical protein
MPGQTVTCSDSGITLTFPVGDPDNPNETISVGIEESTLVQLIALIQAREWRLVKTAPDALGGSSGYPHSQMPLAAASRGHSGPPDGFRRFWAAYPRREAKAEALKVWQTKGLEAVADAIVAHVEAKAQTDSWNEEGGKYVPMPMTYLRQRRWLDAEDMVEERWV